VFEPHVAKVLNLLKDTDLVLDVGGWASPFNRANWILDAQPFETRGFYRTFGGKPFQGPEREWFTKETWVQRDICDKVPFPFPDKHFDFAICSHTLEDLRDPLWVCAELARVAKRGYVEVPSREWETCRGCEYPTIAGLSHHRWLIELSGTTLRFLQKFHTLHAHWRFSLPVRHLRGMTAERTITALFWENDFSAEEVTIHGQAAQEAELERFVASIRPYSPLRLALDRKTRALGALARRGTRKLRTLAGKRAQ
jgi:hypothetical protein